MNRYYLILVLLLCGCTTLKESMAIEGTVNDAINNAIRDFVHTENKLLKDDNMFLVSANTLKDNIVVTIIGDANTVLLIMEEDSSYSYRAFPTMLVEIDGKLFFWYDETKNVTESIISTLYKYNFVDTMIVNAYIPDRIFDDSKKSIVYCFCRNNLSNYKKRKGNTLTKHYKQLKLECNKYIKK